MGDELAAVDVPSLDRTTGSWPVIRRLTPDDAASFREIRHLGMELHPEAFATGADAWKSPSDAAVLATLGSSDAPFDRFVTGAFDDGRLVGVLGFKREGRESLRHKGTCWGLFVLPEERRKGRGASLLEATVVDLRAAPGLAFVRAVVTTADEAALRLLVRKGFVQYGLEKGGLHRAGVVFDQAFLRLDL